MSLPDTNAPLLMTKFYTPRPHPDLVPRPRLQNAISAGLHVPLTLVSAPAGFGKTTVVAQWVQQTGVPVVWLSLDAQDNDPAIFLRYLVATFQQAAPRVGASVLAMLQRPQPPSVESLLTFLVNDLAELDHDLLLVLDDFHVLHNMHVHKMVDFLLQHHPPQLHLVITTREEPSLPLTRFRARRQLVEIRANDLRFTLEEATALLRVGMRLQVTDAEVAALEMRTEGWIAGLHLAALALENRPDVASFVRAFTGSHKLIVEYLAEEVMQRLPAHLREFVLSISILDRFCAPLCDALTLADVHQTESSYSQVLIEQLEKMNLFIIPLDDKRHWFRFHHLFADVLRGYLSSGASYEQQTYLYERASQWCESHHLIIEALDYAFRGKDTNRAADLLERHADSIVMQNGPSATLDWMAKLPRASLEARPSLAVKYVSVLVFIEPHISADDPNHLAEQAATWRTMIALMTEQPAATTIAQGVRAFELMDDRNTAWGRINSLILGCGYAQNGDDAIALDMWRESVRNCQATGDGLMEVNTITHIGRVLIYQGRLREAEATLHDLINRADASYLRDIPAKGYALTICAWSLYERNELDRTRAYVVEAIDLCKYWSMPRIILHAYVILAYIEHHSGNVEQAHAAIKKAGEIIEHNNLRQTFVAVAAYQARLWLMQNQLARAAQWAQSWQATAQNTLDPAYDVEHLTLVRVLLAQQRVDQADELLGRLIDQAGTLGRGKRLIEGYVLQALLASTQGNRRDALAALTRALSLGERAQVIRTFVDEGLPMVALLEEARDREVYPSYCTGLLDAFPTSATNNTMLELDYSNVPTPQHATNLVEPLNEREQEVLRLIALGNSNRDIASKLMVSYSTVKWHINHLYGKLGVSTRTQAIAQARQLGLLS
jgi:LuxR family maltose regulon positive regulatory protein